MDKILNISREHLPRAILVISKSKFSCCFNEIVFENFKDDHRTTRKKCKNLALVVVTVSTLYGKKNVHNNVKNAYLKKLNTRTV